LIANNFERQGVLLTTASLVTVTVVTYLLGKIIQ
ncbi:poly-gamma-glutamate biosynthesis protein PgsC, partial [candidate division KSB1 bacterium]|nr:poly-gamma-glutamate biosynthesis protein PgsC [candidate division KSB1 bacterium]